MSILLKRFVPMVSLGKYVLALYSTNALDLVKNKKTESISKLREVSVDKHIRQLEESNLENGTPLPYANKGEKEQYIKAAHYFKLKNRFESTSSQSENTIQIRVVFKTPFSPNIYDMEKHPLYGMPQNETKSIVEGAAHDILNGLTEDEYNDLWPLGTDNIMSIRVTNSGLKKLYLNPNVLDIFQPTRMKATKN